jgi:hypothetical protein
MQITMLATPGSQGGLYPDFVGKRSVFVGVGTGPTSYTAGTADAVSLNITPFYIDTMFSGGLDTTGNYMVLFYSKVTGTRQTWYARYFHLSAGAFTEYTGNLSAITWQVGGIGGQF